MNTQKIKQLLSREVISQLDGSIKPIVQQLAFNPNNKIDWDNLYKVIIESMPELKQHEGYSEANMQ